jgi:hypothetical protein
MCSVSAEGLTFQIVNFSKFVQQEKLGLEHDRFQLAILRLKSLFFVEP